MSRLADLNEVQLFVFYFFILPLFHEPSNGHIPGAFKREVWYTLEQLPVYHRANMKRQPFILSFASHIKREVTNSLTNLESLEKKKSSNRGSVD